MKIFSCLLFFSILVSYYCGKNTPEEKLFYILIYNTQLFCVANLFFEDLYIQLLLHDCFVYVLVYGLMCTPHIHTKLFAISISTAMIVTRMMYDRCIFLWWNKNRNIDFDIIVFTMIIISYLRKSSVLPNWVCIFIGCISHFLPDCRDDSFVFYILKHKM